MTEEELLTAVSNAEGFLNYSLFLFKSGETKKGLDSVEKAIKLLNFSRGVYEQEKPEK